MKKTPDNPILSIVKPAQPVNEKGQVDKFGDNQIGDFFTAEGSIWFLRDGRDTKNGTVNKIPTALTHNFIAMISEQIIQDDGARQETAFVIEGKQKNGPHLPTLTIPATQYQTMQWPIKHYGARGIVEANAATPRRLANAILILSGDIAITTVYQHTGWRKIDDQWHYLSSSGAISGNGLNPDIRVDMGGGHMNRYALPAPADDPRQAAKALFNLLTIANNNPVIGAALFCSVVRAALGECLAPDFSLFLAGQSGSFKSECAALAQSCYGEFNSRTLPANFSDSESDLEYKLHQAKDAILVIDDLAPAANMAEAHKQQAKCDKAFRGVGNGAGRGRRNTNMSAMANYSPRCMTVATGEDLPKGKSLLGRLLVIEMKKGEIQRSVLRSFQDQSKKGEFSACIAAFVKWLAPRMTELKNSFPEKVINKRDDVSEKFMNSHARATDIFASLYVAADLYIDFAHEVGAINSIRAVDEAEKIENALKNAILAQGQFQKQSDEVDRFIALLRGCFSSGECHVGDHLNQGPPLQMPFVWGWRQPSQDADVAGRGQNIGWLNQAAGELWLEPESTFKVIQRFASSQNDPMLMQKSTLWRRLLERGKLLHFEEDKNTGIKRPDVKRSVSGKRPRVLVFDANIILQVGDDD